MAICQTRVSVIGSRAAVIAVSLILMASSPRQAWAQSASEQGDQANTALREAERSPFAGKVDQTAEQLTKAADLIEKLKAADAKSSRLRTLEPNWRS